MNKLKTFFWIYATSSFGMCLIWFFINENKQIPLIPISLISALLPTGFIYLCNLHKILLDHFDQKTYAEQAEIDFQNKLRREVERKRALLQVDNENLHYQNQLRIEAIAKIAYIHLQSNQHLASMYQQAIFDNSRNQENAAAAKLLELEQELQRQGLI